MGILSMLNRKPVVDEEPEPVNEIDPRTLHRGPYLAVLEPDVAGISSFRLQFFSKAGQAEDFVATLRPDVRRGTHAFWAMHERPEPGDDIHIEALVLVRANEHSDVVYVVSFLDIESAESFTRFEVKRGLELGNVLIYWAAFTQVREELESIAITPAAAPPAFRGEPQGAHTPRVVAEAEVAVDAYLDKADAPVQELSPPIASVEPVAAPSGEPAVAELPEPVAETIVVDIVDVPVESIPETEAVPEVLIAEESAWEVPEAIVVREPMEAISETIVVDIVDVPVESIPETEAVPEVLIAEEVPEATVVREPMEVISETFVVDIVDVPAELYPGTIVAEEPVEATVETIEAMEAVETSPEASTVEVAAEIDFEPEFSIAAPPMEAEPANPEPVPTAEVAPRISETLALAPEFAGDDEELEAILAEAEIEAADPDAAALDRAYVFRHDEPVAEEAVEAISSMAYTVETPGELDERENACFAEVTEPAVVMGFPSASTGEDDDFAESDLAATAPAIEEISLSRSRLREGAHEGMIIEARPSDRPISYAGDEEREQRQEDPERSASPSIVSTMMPSLEATASADEANPAPTPFRPDRPFNIDNEVGRLLNNRRWEKRESPFDGFNSPPGRF